MGRRDIGDTLALGASSVRIPQLGFGVYQSPRDVCIDSCLAALASGYRHIDTAQYYANEAEVGQAVQRSGLRRSEVFLTTKVLEAGGSVELTYRKCVDSIQKLDPGHGYVDLFLIHSPNFGRARTVEMWRALERLHAEGKARSIGVSNFGIGHIDQLRDVASIWPPHVNQIELHPWLQQKQVVDYCEKQGIVIEAYCPLVRNMKAEDETLVKVARKHGVSPSQLLIRYCLQKNWVPLPKSDNQDRIKANADVFHFELDEADMTMLNGLDQGPAGAIVQVVDNKAWEEDSVVG